MFIIQDGLFILVNLNEQLVYVITLRRTQTDKPENMLIC